MATLKNLIMEQAFVLNEKDEEWSPGDIVIIVKEWLTEKRDQEDKYYSLQPGLYRKYRIELLGQLLEELSV